MTKPVSVPRILIAGATSGVGKTTITAGIIAALKARGMNVQPFKCGPDYIDPGYLSLASGRPCRNLDSWLIPQDNLRGLFARAVREADIAVVEGVMGLYDGRNGMEGSGSSAEIARLLDIPVILVLDVSRTSGSAAAMALGYRSLDTRLNIAGVILNRVGSPNHLRWTKEAVEKKAGIPVVGYLPGQTSLHLPERHLGLVPAPEIGESCLESIRRQVEKTIDLEAVTALANKASPVQDAGVSLFPPEEMAKKVKIAVARDEAFSFYYEDNLELLSAWGAQLEFVSPLKDRGLPAGAGGIYIGGGFPEIFARQLAGNAEFKSSLSKAAGEGMPVYAECGGLMYLSRAIVDFEGEEHEMAGVLPGRAVMRKHRKRMGYAEVRALRDGPVSRKGDALRGHFFHWSEMPVPEESAAYRVVEPEGGLEGILTGPENNIQASYLHLHFGSDIRLAKRFIEQCRRGTAPIR